MSGSGVCRREITRWGRWRVEQPQTGENIIYIMRNTAYPAQAAPLGCFRRFCLAMAMAMALARLLPACSFPRQGRAGPWAGFGFQAGHMFTPEGRQLEPGGMACDDGRGPRRGGHPIGTAPKGLCYNEIQRHLPWRSAQNPQRTAVGRGRIRSRRRAVQCGLHEPWVEASPARVRRLP